MDDSSVTFVEKQTFRSKGLVFSCCVTGCGILVLDALRSSCGWVVPRMVSLNDSSMFSELRSLWFFPLGLVVILSGSFRLTGATGEYGPQNPTWLADNGNGTFTNPIFHDEFSDPDLIRVGDDYYLTGTTMHTMPGLPVLHSKDLVNWELLSYASPQLDLGPEFRLEGGEIYGQGFWAPCIRYHDGTFYIFSNVNRHGTQVFMAQDPRGPWEHRAMDVFLHDLSVLFDDDGTIYVVWGYNELRMAQVKPDMSGLIPDTEQVIIPANSGAGEGSHIYKIDGRYYITITNYEPVTYQITARADHPYGPYEWRVTSFEESLGVHVGWRMWNVTTEPPFDLVPPNPRVAGGIPMSQGGIVETQSGEWWGFTMMDYNSVGRVWNLSPVTWEDGWPYFGLSGNLGRSPRSWVKPNTGHTSAPGAPYQRSDDFSGARLNPVWQWNHVPVDGKWEHQPEEALLRLHALPSDDFWMARNTLTQRAVGPESIATVELDGSAMEHGGVAGLGLLNLPYAWLAVVKTEEGFEVRQFDQRSGKIATVNLESPVVWLRAHGDFDQDLGWFSYSTDGDTFSSIGAEFIMAFQLKTFQGVRYSLFHYNTRKDSGGHADFHRFILEEPRHGGFSRPIPDGVWIQLRSIGDGSVLVNWRNSLRPVAPDSPLAEGRASHFRVVDRGNGRVSLVSAVDDGYITVKGMGHMSEVRIGEDSGQASQFQWIDMLRGDVMLLSHHTNRYLKADPHAYSLTSARGIGSSPDRSNGTVFIWTEVEGATED